MTKAKIIGIIIGIVMFISAMAGLTYAWFTWQSDEVNITGKSGCFIIDYGISQQIGGDARASLSLGDVYTSGLSAIVTLSLNEECTEIAGEATLYLNTIIEETSQNIFGGALKYTVTRKAPDEEIEILGTGVITSADKITLLSDIDIEKDMIEYTYQVWVWLDGTVADNNYANVTYTGYISAEAIQKSL